jgi:hypothetical protein
MKPRGFTTILALILVALVAAALSTIAIAMHLEQTRMHAMQTQAALRQLLLAGTTDSQARATHWPAQVATTDWSVDLPPELSGINAKLTAHLEPRGPDNAQLGLRATIDRNSTDQQILFHHNENGWTAQSTSQP